mgnify:CR=1 FL=1
MSDFPFSIPRRGDADVVNGVSYAGTTLTLTRAEGSDLTTTIAAGDPTKIENGNSSMEIASANGDCVFTPNGDAAKTTTFAANGDIHTTGNVGIGTSSPQYELDVNSGSDVMLRLMSSADTTGKLLFGRQGTTDIRSSAIEVYNDAGAENNYMKFLVHDGTDTSPYETRKEVMTLVGNGDITTSGDIIIPQLWAASGASDKLLFKDNSPTTSFGNAGINFIGGAQFNEANGSRLSFFTNDTASLNIIKNGNVGINDTTPTEKLEVGGNIKLSGGLEIGGSLSNGNAIHLTGSSPNPRIVTTNGALSLLSEYNIEFETDTNGNNLGAEYIFKSRPTAGAGAVEIMNLNGNTGNLLVKGTVTPNHSFSDDRLKTDEAYLENATESIGKLSVQTYNKEQLLNFNLLERTGETVREVGVIAQEVYYNAPEFRNLIETGYNKTYDASYITYEDVSNTTWDGDVSNTTFERVSTVVPKRLKTSTKIIPSEMDLSGVPIGEDPDYEAAGWSKEEPASVNYQGFIPYLIKSIQELTERLAALENK